MGSKRGDSRSLFHPFLVIIASVLVWLGASGFAPPSDVPAGSDMLVTPGLLGPNPTPTYDDVALPANFFGAGSQPFSGRIYFVGSPLGGVNADGADTIVERLDTAVMPLVGTQDTVPIEICALSLVSANPITVSFGGPSSQYQVRACLSSTQSQVPGSMTLRHTEENGGQFDSTLPVIPRLIFTRVSGGSGLASTVMDPAPTVTFTTTDSHWAHAANPGLGIISSVNPLVDHDCNPATPLVACASSTPNFVVGVRPSQPNKKCLTPEQAILARHGILPNETPAPDSDGDGLDDPADNCPHGFNPLQEDCDNDCRGDICDLTPCGGGGGGPLLPPWGLALFLIGLAGTGVWILSRRSS